MPESPNKLIKFWQELKRRNVFRVTATYAATAYIIVEVTNNLIVPLHLPDWIATLVVILLIIGLPIVVILSWIFDFTPEGIIKTESVKDSESKKVAGKPVKRSLRTSDVIIAVLMVIVVILAYPKIFNRDKLENLRSPDGKISVAVMPFQNMTNDTTWDVWQDGIQNELITALTNYEELKVRQIETINSVLQSKGLTNYASITPSLASSFSQKLEANVLIYGSIKQAGATIRLNAQLIDSKTEEAFKSVQIDGTGENILHLIDSLSVRVKNFLIISKLEKEVSLGYQHLVSTNSPEAYRFFMFGENARSKRDYPTARKNYSQALAIDSNFTLATLMLSTACINEGLYEEAKKWDLRAYEKREQMPLRLKIFTDENHAFFYETPLEEIKYLRQFLQIDDQYPRTYYEIGRNYLELFQYDKAIPEFKKALEIYDKLDSKPWWIFDYTLLGGAYHETGEYKKERKLYKKAEKDFPDDPILISRQAILSLTEGDTISANRYIDKYRSILKNNSSSEAAIATNLAGIYIQAGIPDKAEVYYRQALSLQPDNPNRLNNLAWFLIDNDRNINEGLELANKALELRPGNYIYLDSKGWGLYKQGKYEEALQLLEKSWDLKPIYEHEIYLHIQEVKKAIANQKNN